MNFENLKDMKEFCKYNKIDVANLLWDTCEKSQEKIEALKAENESLTKQLETRTIPLELQYGDLTNYIGYGQSETEKLVAITFGVLNEKGSNFGEEKEGEEPLFIAYFDRIESLEVLENLVNIGKARLKELQKEENGMCKCDDVKNSKYGITLASGNYTVLNMGKRDKDIFIMAIGDDNTEEVIINYCPFCGKKLKEVY